jgi:hypothetical protein
MYGVSYLLLDTKWAIIRPCLKNHKQTKKSASPYPKFECNILIALVVS